jgi:hypothetical protein
MMQCAIEINIFLAKGGESMKEKIKTIAKFLAASLFFAPVAVLAQLS